MWNIIFWAVLTVVLIVAEIATVQLVSVWFAAGGLCAFIASLCGLPIGWQLAIFVAVSFILLFATRPIVKKLVGKKVKTNIDAVINCECVVHEDIDNLHSTGRVMLEGQDWAARNIDGNETIEKGETCVVCEVHGVTLFVRKKVK